MKRMITSMFFAPVTFLKRAPRIIIYLARNAEKGGGVLMSVTLPNLNHSFIFLVPVPDPVLDFRVFHTPIIKVFHVGETILLLEIEWTESF